MAETSAQELREAAKLIRERAQAATPGPWQHMCLGSEGCLVLRANGTVRERDHRVARFGQKEWKADHADADYVTGMHPGVALKVADLLDKLAWMGELDPDMLGRVGCDEAIAVARAFLGIKESRR